MKSKSFFTTCMVALVTLLVMAASGCTSSPYTSSPTTSQPDLPTSSLTPTVSVPPSTSPSTSVNAIVSQTTSQDVTVNMPSFADLVSVVEPSVVQIDISANVTSFHGTVQEEGAGSGWILDADGTIVTNYHVIEGATTITVTTSDGRKFPAQVINSDPATDVALIKINATQLQAVKIGDASKLRSGDWVLAVGNPLGQGIIVTQGIVSRVGVSVPISATQTYNDLIETTAPINPGNSGGPLVNMAGEVVGITTLGVTGVQGMGYAISMVNALPVIQKLSK
jgi:serine protease Do